MSTTSHFPVLEAYAKLRREVSRIGATQLKAVDLGLKQMMILHRLLQSPCTMSELADHAQSDKASTTRTVEALARAGLIKRHGDVSDRRKRVIDLTARGRVKAKLTRRVRMHIGARLEATLNAQERKTLAHLLNKVVSGLVQKRAD